MTRDAADHWRQAHAEKSPEEQGWYEPVPQRSIDLVRATGLPPEAGIIDVGGGASALAEHLLKAGCTDLTVADISAVALEEARGRLGGPGEEIEWILADVRDHDFARQYDLWHDRALFHFMVEPEDREAYLRTLARTLRPGGHLVLATFGPQGPEQCSGLPVARYDDDGLAQTLGAELVLRSSSLVLHHTPAGASQQFLYSLFRRSTG